MSERVQAVAVPAERRKGSIKAGAADASAVPLAGHAPLVPVHSSASRALVAVIAILTFLASLCAGAAELVDSSAARWRASIDREATVQVRPNPQRDMGADLAKVADLAQRTAGIRSAAIVPKAESDRMLEPWLGSGLDLADLPIPRLVTLTFEDGARPDLAELRRSLAGEVPGATLDDHQAWLARLSLMANAVVVIGVALTVVVLVAAALAVAFATQGAVAANREVVEVLHYVGATDGFIAWAFQRRFFVLGLKGSAIGAGLALSALAALSFAAASWRESPAGDQIEAMFGSFAIGWRAYAGVGLLAFLVSLTAALVSRFMVKRFLRRTP